MTRTKRLFVLPAAVLASALVLAACGSDKSSSKPAAASSKAAMSSPAAGASSSNNDADVTFAQQMIVHHRGAIEMAKLAGTRAGKPEVKALATKIEAAQQPEIEAMSTWLKSWGKDVPVGTEMGAMSGMGHGSGSAAAMPGTMTKDQMAGLEKAAGTDFDRMFLQMMTEHHNGAITMAKEEQAKGKSTDAISLAAKIVADQTAELAQMDQLLKSL